MCGSQARSEERSAAERRRRQASRRPESCRKMLSVAKTAVERHFSDALVSLRQASLCLLNPQSADVAKRPIPDTLAKCPKEVPGAQTGDPGQFCKGDRSCEIRVNVVLNPTQVRDS